MSAGILIILIIFICEIILAFIFGATAQLFYEKIGLDFRSIIKGLIERLFLMLFLSYNIPSGLTLYSALKLGTRLKHTEPGNEKKENKFNDYYLVGNLVSVSMALFYVHLYNHIETMPILSRLIN